MIRTCLLNYTFRELCGIADASYIPSKLTNEHDSDYGTCDNDRFKRFTCSVSKIPLCNFATLLKTRCHIFSI